MRVGAALIRKGPGLAGAGSTIPVQTGAYQGSTCAQFFPRPERDFTATEEPPSSLFPKSGNDLSMAAAVSTSQCTPPRIFSPMAANT
jgi:hypothetical protein